MATQASILGEVHGQRSLRDYSPWGCKESEVTEQRFIVKTSCNFLLCESILFPSSWIIFTIITLNSFLGRLPTSTSLSCSSVVLTYSFVWNIFFCCLILSSDVLCLWSFFHRVQACTSSCFFLQESAFCWVRLV